MSTDTANHETEPTAGERDPRELAAQIDLLAEENHRLRAEYARARRVTYRRTALGLAFLGLVGLAGAMVFPADRAVLIVLGATGLFAALLTYYLTPEQFIPHSIGRAVYDTYAANAEALRSELGLADTPYYVPIDTPQSGDTVRLFVPQDDTTDLPDPDALTRTFVVASDQTDRGLACTPTGLALFDAFEPTLSGPLSPHPGPLADQLTDGITDAFELATTATPELDADANQLAIGITDSAFGTAHSFDHPIASFLAVGFAIGLDAPITLDTTTGADTRYDALITLSWPPTSTNPPATESERRVNE